MEDKLCGMLAGHFLGDALGSPYEFGPLKKKLNGYTGLIEHQSVHFNQYQGTRKTVVGQVSDDTEMTIALIDSLTQENKYVPENAAMNYMKFANSCPFLGTNTRNLFYNVKTYKGYQKRYEKHITSVDPANWTQSNGCLMRASPLSIFASDTNAVSDCKLTNPHSETIELARKYYRLLRCALLDENFPPRDYSYPGNFLEDVASSKKGWCHVAFYCAEFHAYQGSSYTDAMKQVIQLGGDTDTNAAITGAVIGARFGYNKLMENPITLENWKKVCSADTSLGDYNRPSNYHPKRLFELGKKLNKMFEK